MESWKALRNESETERETNSRESVSKEKVEWKRMYQGWKWGKKGEKDDWMITFCCFISFFHLALCPFSTHSVCLFDQKQFIEFLRKRNCQGIGWTKRDRGKRVDKKREECAVKWVGVMNLIHIFLQITIHFPLFSITWTVWMTMLMPSSRNTSQGVCKSCETTVINTKSRMETEEWKQLF